MAITNGSTIDNSADPTYTILEADGQYPDNTLEDEIFAPREGQDYRLRFVRSALAPVGADWLKPYSEVPQEIREQCDGLMILKLYVTEADLALFPKLKVYVLLQSCPYRRSPAD